MKMSTKKSQNTPATKPTGSLAQNNKELPPGPHGTLLHTSTLISGPLPPPSVIQGYEQVCPGAADRIIKMAENEQRYLIEMDHAEQNHTHDIEKKEHFEIILGQTFAFLALVVCLIAAWAFAYNGNDKIAGTLIATTLIGIVTLFIKGRKAEKRENLQNNKTKK